MAMDRDQRGRRLEHYRRRDEAEQDRRDRGHDDAGLYRDELEYDDTSYGRASDRDHWRERDYQEADEFEGGRDARDYDTGGRRPLAAEHRARFLRRSAHEARSVGYMGTHAGDWRERDRWNDDGPHAGRGPRGYRRSDERILEDVCERLTSHPSIDATDIEVKVTGGDVTLGGRVESRAIKHLTESMVETVSGVKEVHNQLRVAAAVEGDWPRSAAVERAPDADEPKHRR